MSLTTSLLAFFWVWAQKNTDLEGIKILLILGMGNLVVDSFVSLKDIVSTMWTKDVRPVLDSSLDPTLNEKAASNALQSGSTVTTTDPAVTEQKR